MHADAERRLSVADPHGREMMISCGAALFTARVALRYLGLVPAVHLLPDPDLPNLVARIGYGEEQVAPAEYERDLFAEIPRRRTHRGGFDREPLPASVIAVVRDEASREQASLAIMTDETQRGALAAVVEAADYALRLDAERMREQAKWAPPPGSPAAGRRASDRLSGAARAHRAFVPRQGLRPRQRLGAAADGYGRGAQVGRACLRADHASLTGRRTGSTLVRRCSGCCWRPRVAALTAALHSQPLEVADLRDFHRSHALRGRSPADGD